MHTSGDEAPAQHQPSTSPAPAQHQPKIKPTIAAQQPSHAGAQVAVAPRPFLVPAHARLASRWTPPLRPWSTLLPSTQEPASTKHSASTKGLVYTHESYICSSREGPTGIYIYMSGGPHRAAAMPRSRGSKMYAKAGAAVERASVEEKTSSACARACSRGGGACGDVTVCECCSKGGYSCGV